MAFGLLTGRRTRPARRGRSSMQAPTPPAYSGKIAVLWVVNGRGEHLVAEHGNGRFGPLACVRALEGQTPFELANRAVKTVVGNVGPVGLEVGPQFYISLYRRRYEVQVYILRVSERETVKSLDAAAAAAVLGHIKAWWTDEAGLIADLGLNAGRYLVGVKECLAQLAARRSPFRYQLRHQPRSRSTA